MLYLVTDLRYRLYVRHSLTVAVMPPAFTVICTVEKRWDLPPDRNLPPDPRDMVMENGELVHRPGWDRRTTRWQSSSEQGGTRRYRRYFNTVTPPTLSWKAPTHSRNSPN